MDDAEIEKFGALFHRFIETVVERSPVDESRNLSKRIQDHLGGEPTGKPVVKGTYPAHDHANVHLALEHLFDAPGRSHELIGLTGVEHRGSFSLSEIIENADRYERFVIGSVDYKYLPVAADEELSCVNVGFYLGHDDSTPVVVLLRGPEDFSPVSGITVEVMASTQETGRRLLAEIDALIREHNIFRGKILSLEGDSFEDGIGPFRFHRRPELTPEDIVLPDGLMHRVERQVVGVARRREELLAAGQHLRRGLLLYGPPGTGKTHTIRYLLSQLPDFTAVILSGDSIRHVGVACSIARAMQPALVILEDCDLVAEARDLDDGLNPLLFQVLNEMDGLGNEADVAFLLTTNRADILEPALSQRPGRVDMAVEIPLPNKAGRYRLVELYARRLSLAPELVDEIVERTEGTTASFTKELMRRAVLVAAEREAPSGPEAVDVREALDELLSDRDTLTRRLLGGESDSDGDEQFISIEFNEDED